MKLTLTITEEEIIDILREKYQVSSDMNLVLEIVPETQKYRAVTTTSIDKRPNIPATKPVKTFKTDKEGLIVTTNDTEFEKPPVKKQETKIVSKKQASDEIRKCEICGAVFTSLREGTRTCSPHCRSLLTMKIRKGQAKKAVKPTKQHKDGLKVDYTEYGVRIENFLKSTGRTASVDLEGLTASGMLYRYRKAAEIFGFNKKIKLNANQKYNELTMSKVEGY